MAYIYKRKTSSGEYYYLRTSVRKGNRVISKNVAYLGNSLEKAKIKLSELKGHDKEIRKNKRKIDRFFESEYYINKARSKKYKKNELLGELQNEIEACKIHFDSKFIKEHKLTRDDIWLDFLVLYSQNSVAIEGNTITVPQARDLIINRVTPNNKDLREVYDLENHKRLFFSLFGSKKSINEKLIQEIHNQLMENIDSRKGYRTRDVRVVGGFGRGFKTTTHTYISTDMKKLLEWYEDNKNKLHPIVLSAIFHHKFESIHPFFDGNGRTGRMILNYMLMLHGYPPVIIKNKLRSEYYNALRSVTAESSYEKSTIKYKPIIEEIGQSLIQSYWDVFL